MGFKGYINSDTGIVHNMCWGVDMLDEPERIGYAVTQSGVDLISGLLDNELGEESYARGTNDYYDTHAVPAGFKKEDLVLTDASLNRAVSRTLTELFRQGMFEDTYADPRKAAEVVATKADWEEASRVHRESVVLLKNDGTLPLKDGTKVYAEAFGKSAKAGEAATKALREMLGNVTLVDTPDEAQVALLMVSPSPVHTSTPPRATWSWTSARTRRSATWMRAASPPPRPTRRPLWWAQTVWPVSLLRSTPTAARSFPTSTARWPGRSAMWRRSPTL